MMPYKDIEDARWRAILYSYTPQAKYYKKYINPPLQKNWRENNKEKIRKYVNNYYQKSKEKILQHKKEYYQNNKEERKKYQREYRLRKKNEKTT